MRYTIREITSGWSVIDYPEYFRDLDTAIYNVKEWSKGNKSMFYIIDDCDNVFDENGLPIGVAEEYKGGYENERR